MSRRLFMWSNSPSNKFAMFLHWYASNAVAIPSLIEHTLSFARMSIADFRDCIDDSRGSYTVGRSLPTSSYAGG